MYFILYLWCCLQMKKDYLAGGTMADSADLVVLGAYYGTGNKGTYIRTCTNYKCDYISPHAGVCCLLLVLVFVVQSWHWCLLFTPGTGVFCLLPTLVFVVHSWHWYLLFTPHTDGLLQAV